jgi:hypothetical protein|tara:strand:- start:473 stop:760 length:288 start_codon:yes stop_codon:yes gene_type:complete
MKFGVHAAFGSSNQTSTPPLSDAQTGRCAMGLQLGSINHHGILFAALGGQSHHHLCENAFVAPTLLTVVERLVAAILLRRISPSQTIAIDEDNPA